MRAEKAKTTHDAAMSIITGEARARALKTERLRELRLAHEAQANARGEGTPSVAKSRKPAAKSKAAS
jgi:hypothetical protein